MEELEKVLSLFDIFIHYERELENARILLASNLKFEPFTSFKEIDESLSGFITPNDLQAFCAKNNFFPETFYLKKLVNSYSTHENEKLFVGDFLKFILPCTKISLREDALRRQGGKLNHEVLDIFLNVFVVEIEMWKHAEIVKKNLSKKGGTTPIKVFESIDVPRGGYLTVNKIKGFLEGFNRKYQEQEIEIIVKRIDLDKDGIINLNEFLQAFRPEYSGSEQNNQIKASNATQNLNSQNEEVAKTEYLNKNEYPIKNHEHTQKTYKKSEVKTSIEKIPEEMASMEETFKVPEVNIKVHSQKSSKNDFSDSLSPPEILSFLIEKILSSEEILDREKKTLITCPDFNLKKIFRMFDENNLGFSNESDFAQGLQNLGIKQGKEEISLIFKHYSEIYNKRLSFFEFSQLFLPYLEKIEEKNTEDLHKSTIKKIKNLLETHFEQEILLEKCRQIWKKKNIKAEQVFRVFGTENVEEFEIRRALIHFRVDLNEKQLFWILNYFKSITGNSFGIENFEYAFLPRTCKRLI